MQLGTNSQLRGIILPLRQPTLWGNPLTRGKRRSTGMISFSDYSFLWRAIIEWSKDKNNKAESVRTEGIEEIHKMNYWNEKCVLQCCSAAWHSHRMTSPCGIESVKRVDSLYWLAKKHREATPSRGEPIARTYSFPSWWRQGKIYTFYRGSFHHVMEQTAFGRMLHFCQIVYSFATAELMTLDRWKSAFSSAIRRPRLIWGSLYLRDIWWTLPDGGIEALCGKHHK